MNIVFINYNSAPGFSTPAAWLHRIRAYTGIPEALASRYNSRYKVSSIEQIDYEGEFIQNGVHYHFRPPGKHDRSSPGDQPAPHPQRPGLVVRLLREMAAARRLHRYVATLAPDIVIVHGLLFPLQIILLKRQLGRNIKIIVQNHAEQPGLRYKKILQRIADRSVDAYLFAAKEMGMDWVRQGIIAREEKIHEVMEASSVFSPEDRILARSRTGAKGDRVFLWVGRLDRNKDPLTVVKAFLKFAAQRPGARLYMIYHTEELLAEIKNVLAAAGHPGADQPNPDHPVANHFPPPDTSPAPGQYPPPSPVILVGRVPHEEMGHWYNSADLILSGSHFEGSGVAVCEAMSCGCIPVLTDILAFRTITGSSITSRAITGLTITDSNITGRILTGSNITSRTITDDGGCGILYTAGDETALLTALMRISDIDIPQERQKVLAQFRVNLSFEAIAAKIGEIADSL